MAESTFRDGFRTVTPYLLVKSADGLIRFLTEAFGATLTMRKDRPDSTGIMHAEMKIGDSMVMLADATDGYPPMPSMVFLYVDDVDATYASAIHAGATEVQAPGDQSHGDRMGGVSDPFGNQWWIASPLAVA